MNQIVTKDVFLKIESFGDRYIKEELVPWDKTKLTADWWYALLFFFGRSFYQGRRDSVSSQIKRTAVEALEDDILGKDIHEKERKLKLHLGSGDLDWKKMQSSTNLLQKALLKERPMQLDNGRTKELRVMRTAFSL